VYTLTSILSPRRRGRKDREALSPLWLEGERDGEAIKTI